MAVRKLRTQSPASSRHNRLKTLMETGINVLSLFDGMSCGQIALGRAGIKVNQYYASEVDKYAIKITQKNYPNTIQLGSVVFVSVETLPKIDLVIGGSPCQNLSFLGNEKGLTTKCNVDILTLDHYLKLKLEQYEFSGQSYLFWEYVRILKEVQKNNPNVKFLLENVNMDEKWRKIFTRTLGVNYITIDSNLVSAQDRDRHYWTNIGLTNDGVLFGFKSNIEMPRDKGLLLKDVLENEVDEKYFLEYKNDVFLGTTLGGDYRADDGYRAKKNGKSGTLRARARTDESCGQLAFIGDRVRKLTPIECERLQTITDDYTIGVPYSQRYKMIGNGWTVDVVTHIFKYYK